MKNTKTHQIVLIGLMAAIVFVSTAFIHIPIPTPTGTTMLKTGNIFCLLAALLLGKLNGGLAAGIGSMFYDLLNPLYISSAPFTLVFFFTMAYIAGTLFELINPTKSAKKIVLLPCLVGTFSYVALYFTKSVIASMLLGRCS